MVVTACHDPARLDERLGESGRIPCTPCAGHLTRLEMQYRSTIILTFGGGTNEMQRDLISQFGLGYPKADR